MMVSQRLLCVTDKYCRMASWRRNQWDFEKPFPNSEEELKNIGRWLGDGKKAPFSILADLVEEDFRSESIPHLGARDRKLFYSKRLDQYYPHTPFRQAIFQESIDKLNDRVLFSALTSPNLVLPWVEWMIKNEIPLSGIRSPAMLSEILVAGFPFSHLLFCSYEAAAGLRQSFFLNGKLNFSRLTPVQSGEDLSGAIFSESDRIYKYLHMLNLLPESGPLAVCILCCGKDRKEMQQALEDNPSLRYFFYDVKEAAGKIGFMGEIEESDAMPLFCHLLERESFANQYGNEEHLHFYRIRQWKLFFISLSFASLLIGVLWAGVDVARAMSLYSHAKILEGQASVMRQSHGDSVAPGKGIPVSAQGMKEAALVAERISSGLFSARQFFSEMSRALAPFPSIRISRLSFSQDQEAPRNDFSSRRAILIEGDVFPFDRNYRQAIATVNGFSAALGKGHLDILAVKLPLDLSPESSLSSKPSEEAGFVLQAIWKEKP